MKSSLGEKICELRKQKGLSQEALGDMIGVSRQAISKWELDEMTPNLDNISQLSKFFAVGVNYFIDDCREINEVAATKDVAHNYFKRWLIFSIIGGIAFVALTIFTICMSIIIMTSNTGDQIVQTSKVEQWELIILIVLCVLLLIAEAIFIVFAVKHRRCK